MADTITPGTRTIKTWEQICEVLQVAYKGQHPAIDVEQVAPIYDDSDQRLIVGVELVHREPLPKPPRADKGIKKGPRGSKTPPSAAPVLPQSDSKTSTEPPKGKLTPPPGFGRDAGPSKGTL